MVEKEAICCVANRIAANHCSTVVNSSDLGAETALCSGMINGGIGAVRLHKAMRVAKIVFPPSDNVALVIDGKGPGSLRAGIGELCEASVVIQKGGLGCRGEY